MSRFSIEFEFSFPDIVTELITCRNCLMIVFTHSPMRSAYCYRCLCPTATALFPRTITRLFNRVKTEISERDYFFSCDGWGLNLKISIIFIYRSISLKYRTKFLTIIRRLFNWVDNKISEGVPFFI